MIVRISPSVAQGCVVAPPSKSMAHRALLCGALSAGSVIRHVAYSQDISATLSCLERLGTTVKKDNNTVALGGLDIHSIPPDAILDCGESGSTLRFLLPLCMLAGHPITLTGRGRLFQRPLTVYEDIACRLGIEWRQTEDTLTVCGRLQSGDYTVPGDVSSQFITGLLYALPLLKRDSRLMVTGAFESASYIDLTLDMLTTFGISIHRQGNAFIIGGNQTYAVGEHTVEGDCSNAAFLEAFNLLGGDVKVNGLSDETKQGDRVYREFFRRLEAGERQFDLSDCPDLGPVMMAVAAVKGGAVFSGSARLRLKESDRGAAMAQELAKCGIPVKVEENSITVCAGVLRAPTEPFDGHNDHRVVMALSLICSRVGGCIRGAQAVSKSFPDYFDILRSIGIGVTEE